MNKRINLKDLREAYAKTRAINDSVVELLVKNHPALDEDGYPTDQALNAITFWNPDDRKGWLGFIESIWWGKAHGSWETITSINGHVIYGISTLGWSGNESIIKAMRENDAWWGLFYSEYRGGHYELELVLEEDN